MVIRDGVGSRVEKWVFNGGTHVSLIIRLGWQGVKDAEWKGR